MTLPFGKLGVLAMFGAFVIACGSSDSSPLASEQNELSKKKATCTYDGSTHGSGTTFPSSDGCNVCTCLDGHVLCTKRACVLPPADAGADVDVEVDASAADAASDDASTDDASVDDASTDDASAADAAAATGCDYAGIVHADGDRFPSSDGCNQCVCDMGHVFCTKRMCVAP